MSALHRVDLGRPAPATAELFRAAVEASPDGFVLFVCDENEPGTSSDFICVDLNGRAAKLLGCARPAAIGRSAGDLLPPNYLPDAVGKLTEVVARQLSLDEELPLAQPQSDITWLRWQIAPLPGGVAVTIRDVSERKEMEQVLQRERDLLQVLMDNIPDTIYFKDREGRFTRINRAQMHMLGLIHEDEALGKTDADFFDERLALSAFQHEQQLMATGIPLIDDVHDLTAPDGLRYWFSASKVPIKDRLGRPIGMVGISRDISARVEGDAALRRSQAQLADAQRVAQLGSWVWDRVENTVTLSDELCRIYGLSPQAAPATFDTVMAVVHPDDRATVNAAVRSMLVDGRPSQVEHRIVRPDGEIRVIAERAEIVLDDRQQPRTIIGTAQDISARVQTAHALRLRDQAIGATTSGVLVTDANAQDNPAVLVNPAFLQLTGYREDEVIGRNCRFLQGPDTDPATVAILHDAVAEGRPISVEILNYRKDGTPFWNALSLAPMHDAWGRLTNFVGVQQDITARKQADELRQSKEIAEQASRAKSEFLSRVSHELRTPLNAILGFGQLLEMADLGPEQHDNVAHILDGGRHLLALINEVLDLTSIEAGRSSLVLEPVAIDELIGEARALLTPLALRHQVNLLQPAMPDAVPPVLTARRSVLQVLLNLISNALKYTPAKGEVIIHRRPVGSSLRVAISDTGIGIPADKLSRLFTPFDRLDAETTGIEGTGLGLSLSKALIEELGGTIGVQSAPGQGSTFWFELPLSRAPA